MDPAEEASENAPAPEPRPPLGAADAPAAPTERVKADQASGGVASPGTRRPGARDFRLRLALGLAFWATVSWATWRELRFRSALHEAKSAFAKRDWAGALRQSQAALARKPVSTAGASLAARSLSRLHRAKEAEPYYRHAGTLGLDDMHLRAKALLDASEADAAARVYQEILQHWPRDVLATRRLAAIYISRRQWSEALALAEGLIARPETEVIGQTLAGSVHHHKGEYPQAIDAYERVLVLDPNLQQMPLSPPQLFWDELAHDLLAEGRPAEARRHLLRALERQDDAVLLDLLGQTYKTEGNFDEAERYWRRAVEADASRCDPWLNLGRLALQKRDLPEAIRLLSRAAVLSPESVDPVYNLSRAYRLQGEIAEADRLLKHAEALRQAQRPPAPAAPPGGHPARAQENPH